MNKQYMLYRLRERVKILSARYYAACKCQRVDGKKIKEGTASVIRAHCKRDLQILALIEQLLLTSKAVFIEEADAIEGFEKLIEPNERS